MLQNIRDNVQGTVAKVIIAIIIVPFAIFGVESLVGGSGVVNVAEVNGDKISEGELLRAVEMQKRQMLAMMGDNIQSDMLDDSKLRTPALEGLISQQLLLQSAQQLKLRTPGAMVDQTILSMPAFQEDGKFSVERYQVLLRNQGYTPVHFKELLQQEMLGNQVHSGFVGTEFVTDAELKQVAGLLQQQRSFRYLTVPMATVADKITITDADIQAYYNEHPDSFMNEEQVRLDYIELRASDYFQPIDDATLKAEYERATADFKGGSERHAAHILLEVNAERSDAQARELAAEIEKKLAAGESFADLAQRYSDDIGSKSTGGDLGYSGGDTFPPVFEQALAKLKVGEVSAPVKSESGYHLVKLLDEQVRAKPSFEEQKAELAERMQQGGAQIELVKNVEKLRDLVFNSDGLRGAAEDLKLTVRESDWIDRHSTDATFGTPKLLAAAFSTEVLKDRNNSDVIELAPDHYLVLRIKEHKPAAQKPLAEVKPAIAATLTRERANAEANKVAQTLLAQLQQGGDLQKVAKEQGYSAQEVEKSSRNNGAVNPELLRAVFAMPKPASEQPALQRVNLENGDVVLVQLQLVDDSVHEALNPAQRNALVAQLQQSSGAAAFAAYMDSIRASAKIKRL